MNGTDFIFLIYCILVIFSPFFFIYLAIDGVF